MPSEGRSGRQTGSRWYSHAQIRIHQSLSSRGNRRLFRSIQIIAGGECASSCWELRFVAQFLDEEVRAVLDPCDGNGHVGRLGGIGDAGHCAVADGIGWFMSGLGTLWEGRGNWRLELRDRRRRRHGDD